MKHNTMPRKVTLSVAQLRELTNELERERGRFAVYSQRFHVLNEALRRIAEGSYGSCVVCDAAIPFERLSVMPETMYCVAHGARD